MKMNNENSEKKHINCYEDECGSIKNKNYNFDFEFDIDDAAKFFINDVEKIDDEDCEEVYKDGFKDGFKEGYEKAKQEILVYMKKNKCCIKCKDECKVRSINKNKCFMKCKRSCKLRGTKKNKNFHKMIKRML